MSTSLSKLYLEIKISTLKSDNVIVKVLLKGRKYAQNSFYPLYSHYKSESCQTLVLKINTFKALVSLNSKNIEGVRLILTHLSCLILNNHNYFSLNKNEPTFYPLFTTTSSTNARFFKFIYHFNCLISDVLATIVSRKELTLTEISTLLLRGGVEPNPGPEINDLVIVTINCNGLSGEGRLLQTIGRIKKRIKQRNAIIFLQETHNANILLLESTWTGSVNVAMGSGGSRGVITLCTKDLSVPAYEADSEGRALFTLIDCGNNNFFSAANIYSPNDHTASKQFINNTACKWDSFTLKCLSNLQNQVNCLPILAGDLNCVLYSHDAQSRLWPLKERQLADTIISIAEERGLANSVLKSPHGNNFTWNRGQSFSKIDAVFVCASLLDFIIKYDTIWDFVKSDHAAIWVELNFVQAKLKGRSYPKLYSSDLKLPGAHTEIKSEIEQAIKEFPSHWNPHQKLDFIKVVIRTKVLEIRSKNRLNQNELEVLRQQIETYKSLPTLNEQQSKEFNELRSRIYEVEENESEKLRILAGVKWREEGERSTKYFLNSIDSIKAKSNMDYLITENGRLDDIELILDYSKNFYKDLYSKRETSQIEHFYSNCPKLSSSSVECLSRNLSIGDLQTALKSCKDSTPGLDGIPYSYYKTYGNILLPILMDSWNYSIQTGQLPSSQSTSVISLIPKDGKDKFVIKNWRPISISPCDLKIITKAFSLKVGQFLGEVICDSQMGYIPGRNINFNNRLMKSAMTHCKTNNLDYVLTSLDAQKAYDSVDHEYIKNTLRAYGFPNEFIDVVDLLHSNLFAQVQINGFISNRFEIKRGVKQGDALSCALFILAIDPVIRNIECNPNIPYLEITPNCRLKAFAYADDIAVICPNNDSHTSIVFDEYHKLTCMSGLTLNADKTEILNLSYLGKTESVSSYNGNPLYINHKESIVVCGNFLCLDEQKCYEKNIQDKINKLEVQLNRWRGRNLSINGKMIIVKTFAISQLIFSSQFQSIRPRDLRRIESLCYSFVWNGNDRVKRSTLKLPRDEGGIDAIDVESFFYSIAVRQFLKSNQNQHLHSINNCSVIREDIKSQARHIIRKILINQCNNLHDLTVDDCGWIAKTRIDLFLKPYSKSHQLCAQLGLNNVYSFSNILQFRGDSNRLRRALPRAVCQTIDRLNYLSNPHNQCYLTIEINHKMYEVSKTSNRMLNTKFKQIFNKVKDYNPAERHEIPSSTFPDIRSTWSNLWLLKNPTLRAIRLKILHKDIWTQVKRRKLGISNTDECSSCKKREDVAHQLFKCPNSVRFWKIYHELFGGNLERGNPFTYIDVSNNVLVEVVKSAIFKMLIQIDRSINLTQQQIKRSISYWIHLELHSINKISRGNRSLLKTFNNVIAKLTN